jgi:hypothetical protein
MELVSGPASTTIVNPGSASTSILGFVQGTYLFQLEATDDKSATGVDTVSVIVNPSSIKTLTLQPANNPTDMKLTVLNGVSQTGISSISIDVDTWTSGGQLWILRGLLKFDLSSIPSTATIKTANLYLYSIPTPQTGDLVHANAGPTNSFTVQQVTAEWSPGTLTWFNQPGSTTNNQVSVANTSSASLDLNLDVKSMLASMVNSQANYGFLMKLDNEVTYNSRIFVSSFNTTYPDKHPKLVVTYQ